MNGTDNCISCLFIKFKIQNALHVGSVITASRIDLPSTPTRFERQTKVAFASIKKTLAKAMIADSYPSRSGQGYVGGLEAGHHCKLWHIGPSTSLANGDIAPAFWPQPVQISQYGGLNSHGNRRCQDGAVACNVLTIEDLRNLKRSRQFDVIVRFQEKNVKKASKARLE